MTSLLPTLSSPLFWSLQDWNGDKVDGAGWWERRGGKSLLDYSVVGCLQTLSARNCDLKLTFLLGTLMDSSGTLTGNILLFFIDVVDSVSSSFGRISQSLFSKALPIGLRYSSWEEFKLVRRQVVPSNPSEHSCILYLQQQATQYNQASFSFLPEALGWKSDTWIPVCHFPLSTEDTDQALTIFQWNPYWGEGEHHPCFGMTEFTARLSLKESFS